MRFVGVDVAASKGLALVAVDEHDQRRPALFTSPVFDARGARRLGQLREWVLATTPADTVCAVVELPFSPRSSFVLPSIAAVCMEAIQVKAPDAVVMEMPTSSWRKAWFGSGKANKVDAQRLADVAGVLATEDEAEALCMALLARKMWMAEVDRGRDHQAA